jgi:hypothetical protein
MRLILNLFYVLFISLSLGICGFGVSYISEINFIGDEFIELYSDSLLNFKNSIIIDESGKNNSLELVKVVNNSHFYLVVGENFLKSNSIDDLNCSVYVSSGTQVSHGGLKSSGESFSIGNFSFNLSNDVDYNFENDESLNFINGSEYVLPVSVCDFESFTLKPEIPDENLSMNVSCGDYSFDLILKKEIVLDKVEFKFTTNYSSGDYLVNYWVEDYSGDVVKGIRNSTNLNWKSYSPKGSTQILRIFGEFLFGGCELGVSDYVYFYSDYVESKSSSSSSKSKSSDIKVQGISDFNDDLPSEPYVKLLNINSILNLSSEFLEYEIYRGESRKSVINFYLNSRNILKLRLDEFENVSGRVFIDVSRFDYLRVAGLDHSEKFNFSNLIGNNDSKSDKNIKMSKISKQFFTISEIEQIDNKINFDISSNIIDLENICYVSRVRTVVSDSITNTTGNLSLKLFKLDKLSEGDDLKLLCKYRKSGLKSWKYESVEFSYSKQYVLDFVNKSINMYSTFSGKNDNKKYVRLNIDISKFSPVSGEVVYGDKNINFLETSSFFVLLGLMVLMIPMLILW